MLLHKLKNMELIDSIKNRINISLNRHNSKIIAIVGHYDCAGNPTDNNTQITQIKSSMIYIKKEYKNFDDLKIIGLWLDENFKVKKNM